MIKLRRITREDIGSTIIFRPVKNDSYDVSYMKYIKYNHDVDGHIRPIYGHTCVGFINEELVVLAIPREIRQHIDEDNTFLDLRSNRAFKIHVGETIAFNKSFISYSITVLISQEYNYSKDESLLSIVRGLMVGSGRVITTITHSLNNENIY